MGRTITTSSIFSSTNGSNRQMLLTGTGTFTVPDGITQITAYISGAGGSGSMAVNPSAGQGGSSGNIAIQTFNVASGQVINYSCGAGGASVNTNSDGNAGGTTTFNGISATGGEGGVYTKTGAGGRGVNGSGGVGGVAQTSFPGIPISGTGNGGPGGPSVAGGNNFGGGGGGGSLLGSGGSGGIGGSNSKSGGSGGLGAGGGGAATSSGCVTGAGGDGFVLVSW